MTPVLGLQGMSAKPRGVGRPAAPVLASNSLYAPHLLHRIVTIFVTAPQHRDYGQCPFGSGYITRCPHDGV